MLLMLAVSTGSWGTRRVGIWNRSRKTQDARREADRGRGDVAVAMDWGTMELTGVWSLVQVEGLLVSATDLRQAKPLSSPAQPTQLRFPANPNSLRTRNWPAGSCSNPCSRFPQLPITTLVEPTAGSTSNDAAPSFCPCIESRSGIGDFSLMFLSALSTTPVHSNSENDWRESRQRRPHNGLTAAI